MKRNRICNVFLRDLRLLGILVEHLVKYVMNNSERLINEPCQIAEQPTSRASDRGSKCIALGEAVAAGMSALHCECGTAEQEILPPEATNLSGGRREAVGRGGVTAVLCSAEPLQKWEAKEGGGFPDEPAVLINQA